MAEIAIGVLSILIAAGALGWTFYVWRLKELRRDEILVWGNACIEVLQCIFLECRAIEGGQEPNREALASYRTKASVLVEQGRIFFRNANPDQFDQEKESAYRGFRPKILDSLVSGFQVAEAIGSMDDAKLISKCRKLSERNVRSFVSLLQKEIGRDRTASADTSAGGHGIYLPYQLNQIDADDPAY